MKIQFQPNYIGDNVYVLGSTLTPVYLFKYSEKKWMLIDGGIIVHSALVLTQLKEIIDDLGEVKYWLLTHAHYDHCGCVESIMPHLKNVSLLTSANSKRLLKNTKYAQLIRSLNKQLMSEKENQDLLKNSFKFSEISITTLEMNQELLLDNIFPLECIEATGHSDDMVAFWLPTHQMLFCGDALGDLFMGQTWRPLIFYDYKKYLDTIYRFTKLPIQKLFLGHHLIVSGSEVQKVIKKSIQDTFTFLFQTYDQIQESSLIAPLVNSHVSLLYPSVKDFIEYNILYKSCEVMFEKLSSINRDEISNLQSNMNCGS
mgnify:CR=1 FL=1|tara:strand:- start:6502 stop:7443 length:942 start_codon:yes stop_codon:yes gene_type:complete